jgi:hypothetical protein
MEHLQYPIGKLIFQNNFWPEEIQGMIGIIESYPSKYTALLQNVTEEDLTKKYREGSFTVRQLVHHVADMQTLNFFRFKQVLTEESPSTYIAQIDAWSVTPDNQAPISTSLIQLEMVHQRWVYLLRSLSEDDLNKGYFHPVRKMNLDLRQALQLSSWHIQHHYEHLKIALNLE